MSWLDKLLAPIVQVAGTVQTWRPTINLLPGLTATDNPGNNSTDVSVKPGAQTVNVSAGGTITLSAVQGNGDVILLTGTPAADFEVAWGSAPSRTDGQALMIINATNKMAFIQDPLNLFFSIAPANVQSFVWTTDFGIYPNLCNVGGTVSSFLGVFKQVTMTDADYTVQGSEYPFGFLRVTGTLTAARNFILPLILSGRGWMVANATTGGFALTVKGTSGTGVTIANGSQRFVSTDNTNFYG